MSHVRLPPALGFLIAALASVAIWALLLLPLLACALPVQPPAPHAPWGVLCEASHSERACDFKSKI